jgi:hypothetical protein
MEVYSANTEYTACIECSGSTYTVDTPNPVWTDNKGNSVIQLNMVALGGENGLNS